MFKRKDFLIIAAALAVAAGIYGYTAWQNAKGSPDGNVRIFVDGALYATAHLGQAEPVVITQANGETNTVAFTKDGFYMASASCKNQLCVQQGTVTTQNYTLRAMGKQIICLPNRVVVELVVTQAAPADAPDI
jgi:hypothetical protein